MAKKHSKSAITNPVADARKMKRHASATAAELRVFLREIQGKSPKEMLGEVASSNLGRSTVTASIGAVSLIIALTLIPFAWSKITANEKPPPPVAAAFEEVAPVVADRAPMPAELPAGETPSINAIEKLGVGGQRSAPTTVNPLENTNGDLLKDLE